MPTIANLRETVEQIRRSELERLGAKLSDLTDEQRAQVEMITTSIVNKILHMPTVKMKEAAGRDECYLYVDAVRTLFDLSGNGDAASGARGSGGTPARDAGSTSAADAQGGAGARDDEAGARHSEDGAREAESGAPTDAGATVHLLRGTGTEDA